MKIRNQKFTLLLTLALIFFTASGFTINFKASKAFKEGKSEYINGNVPYALLNLRYVLYTYPSSVCSKNAEFGLGECYFELLSYQKSFEHFENYLAAYPDDLNNICAKIYILKITSTSPANLKLFQSYTNKVKKELYDKPFFLAYQDYKGKILITPLGNKFEFREYVNRIEIYKNDQLFYKIIP
ncbi:MAG: hypothetical protein ABH952_05015 [Candidatus Omnitrophota bacterium]